MNKDITPIQSLLIPKPIFYFGKLLNWISPFLTYRFGIRLFLTPFKYKRPEREWIMANKSQKETIHIDAIDKDIIVYNYGDSKKKILLVHGWSGSGTQLSMIADQLIAKGYSTISFDAPAHGEASGKTSNMLEFVAAIHQLEQTHGPFSAAIGHSLGGMSLLRSVKKGLSIHKLVIIGTADSITKITEDFVQNLQWSPKVGKLIKKYFDNHFGEDLDNYSGSRSACDVDIPTLVIHDRNDVDVHYTAAQEINKNLKKGILLLTDKLGHRKILGNQEVIKKIVDFIM